MREIKFRAWDSGTKSMFPPQLLNEMLNEAWDTGHADGYERNEDEYGHLVWMQWTGLVDKKFNDVYEGDIVKFVKWNKTSGGNLEIIGLVKWNNQGGGMWITNGKYYTILQDLVLSGGENGFCMDNLEIVGNIYETPELLDSQ